jgi:Na+/proline symporter
MTFRLFRRRKAASTRRVFIERLVTNFILLGAFVIAIRTGRAIDAAIIGVLLLLGLFFLTVIAVAWKRGVTDEDDR